MHLEDGLLQAFLDDELAPATRAEASAHLDGCAECRNRLAALRTDDELIGRALSTLDHAAPPLVMKMVTEFRLRWAAVIALIVLGAGALYAIPASPLRRWIDTLITHRPAPSETAEHSAAGVALAPGDHFRIAFNRPQSGSVTITLTDGPAVDARCISGTARFVAEIEGLRIDSESAPADFAVAIPRSAPWVEVLAGERRIFLKDRARIESAGPADAQGRYILPLR